MIGKRLRWVRDGAIMLAIALVLLLVLEMALRLYVGPPEFRFDSELIASLPPEISKIYVRSVDGGPRFVRWQTNAQGFRGPALKEAPHLRVMVYGDSNVQARFSTQAETFTGQLQRLLEQARAGRLFILDKMIEAIKEPRKQISPYAPKIITIKINPDKIREIIGPGGKIIRAIQAETNTKIEIDDSGLVKIAAFSQKEGDAALNMVKEIIVEPEVGKIYEGTVVKIMDFGAFVQILPNVDGLVHISQLAAHRVNKVSDIVKEGDHIKVKVLEISKDGKIRLSYKAALEEEG